MNTEANWPVLSLLERRVLGVLVEKAKTTPDVYPMSLNSLVNGCNQKSNRDPVMNLGESQVESTLEGMKPKGLVMQVIGGRVDRWRQQLYEAWSVSKLELAPLAELLLRGPQTEAELRARADRMEPLADIEALKAAIKPLVERKLIVYLTAENRRGALLTHGFHESRELERLKATHAGSGMTVEEMQAPSREQIVAPPPPNPLEAQLKELKGEIDSLKGEVQMLKAEFAEFKSSLGG